MLLTHVASLPPASVDLGGSAHAVVKQSSCTAAAWVVCVPLAKMFILKTTVRQSEHWPVSRSTVMSDWCITGAHGEWCPHNVKPVCIKETWKKKKIKWSRKKWPRETHNLKMKELVSAAAVSFRHARAQVFSFDHFFDQFFYSSTFDSNLSAPPSSPIFAQIRTLQGAFWFLVSSIGFFN